MTNTNNKIHKYTNTQCTRKELLSVNTLLTIRSPEQFKKTELEPFNTRPTLSD